MTGLSFSIARKKCDYFVLTLVVPFNELYSKTFPAHSKLKLSSHTLTLHAKSSTAELFSVSLLFLRTPNAKCTVCFQFYSSCSHVCRRLAFVCCGQNIAYGAVQQIQVKTNRKLTASKIFIYGTLYDFLILTVQGKASGTCHPQKMMTVQTTATCQQLMQLKKGQQNWMLCWLLKESLQKAIHLHQWYDILNVFNM